MTRERDLHSAVAFARQDRNPFEAVVVATEGGDEAVGSVLRDVHDGGVGEAQVGPVLPSEDLDRVEERSPSTGRSRPHEPPTASDHADT